LAERAAHAGDYSQAEKLLDQLLATDCEPNILAHALYLRGKAAGEQRRWTDVPVFMQRVVDEFPDSTLRAPAVYWIGEAYYRLERYEEAELAFAGVAEETQERNDPWLAMVPLRRAQVRAQQGKWQDAYDIAAAIPQRFPEFRQQYEVDYLLGRCLSSQARFSEAREAYLRAVRSPTGGRTETAAMAQWMIGETYLHQKEYDLAIRAYHRVESLYAYPQWQAAALLQAGKCHELKGEWKEAVGLYAQLLKQYPHTEFAEDAALRLKDLRVTDHARRNTTR
jgi:TolA-binding protein